MNESSNNFCSVCRIEFANRRTFLRHNRRKHKLYVKDCPSEFKNDYKCNDCSFTCFKKRNIITHVKMHMNKINKAPRLLCPVPECNVSSARCYKDLREHLTNVHCIKLLNEKITFENEEGFKKWKNDTETNQVSRFVLNTGTKLSKKDGSIQQYYVCHRSYSCKSKNEERKRKLKSSGSYKTGKACPAGFSVRKFTNNKIIVDICNTHVGHDCSLGQVSLPAGERFKIAGKLKEGVEIDRILHDIRDSADPQDFQRVHLIERKDIHNVKQTLGCVGRRHENDAMSVDLWIQFMELRYGADTPVLFYKSVGSSCEYHQLHTDKDFILVISTEFQIEMLRTFGTKKICIDGTHGLNAYKYELFSVVVINEYGNGLPTAYCFSNRGDIEIMKVFFESLKKRLNCQIETEILMTDDTPVFINGWSAIMGPPQKHLLCTWHVNKNWLSHLNSITVPEKRRIVRDSLRTLRSECSVEKLKIFLNNFINLLVKDPDTKSFGLYFQTHYAPPNRYEKWAYAFRQYAGINCNMFLESLHKQLKYCYLKGTKCRRLDKAIDALIVLTRDKMFDRLVKLSKNKLSEKMIRIEKSHRKGLLLQLQDITACEDDLDNASWFVKSSSHPSDCYIVTLVQSSSCQALCQQICTPCSICVHTFRCSCPDSTIYFNICKHIHAVKHFCKLDVTDINTNRTQSALEETVQFLENKIVPKYEKVQEETRSLLETLLGLTPLMKDLDQEQVEAVQRRLKQSITIITKNNVAKSFKPTIKINSRKGVSPQKRFQPIFKKSRAQNFVKVSKAVSGEIKKCLTGSEEVVNINSDSTSDHFYC